jgi:DNA-binding GntR family transcriptional regulator
MLDRDPPYVQIIEHFKQEIATGRLRAGEKIPAAREIAAVFGVSVATAAKAASGLAAAGLVSALPGSGTTVVAAASPAPARAQGGPLVITLASRGPLAPGEQARVLVAELAHPPQRVAAELGAGAGDLVVCRRLAMVRDGTTAALLTSWFPAVLAEAVPALLSAAPAEGEVPGFEPAWGHDWVTARPPSMAETRTFGIKRGSPVVVVHSRRYSLADKLVEYAELVARAGTRISYRYGFTKGDPDT